MPAYPYVNFAPLLPQFGHEIASFQHHMFPQLVWTNVSRLNYVFNVEKVKTIVLRRTGVTDMPGLEEEVECIQTPVVVPHYCKNLTAEAKAVRMEISRRKSVPKAPIITSRMSTPSHPLASALSQSLSVVTAPMALFTHAREDSSDIEIVVKNLHTLQPHLQKHRVKDKPSADNGRHRKHAHKRTAQQFAAHASSSPSPDASSPAKTLHSSSRSRSHSSSSLFIPSSLPSLVSSHGFYLCSDSSDSPKPPPSLSSSSRACSSLSTHSILESSSVRGSRKKLTKAYWYTGLHCVEVAGGIAKMASQDAIGLNKAEHFTFAFGPDCPYNERTLGTGNPRQSAASVSLCLPS